MVKNLKAERARLKILNTPESNAKQETIKLIINCLYGILTSSFFSLSNLLTSEFITGSVRYQCYLAAKAFNLNFWLPTEACVH